MPGLYKQKRKRVTLNSTFTNDVSVWHSTPVDSMTSATSTTSAPTTETERGEEAETLLSPVKRVALDKNGAGRPSSSAVRDETPEGAKGPSSRTLINTPAAAVNVVLDEPDGDTDLFENMEEDPAEEGRGGGRKEAESEVRESNEKVMSAPPAPKKKRNLERSSQDLSHAERVEDTIRKEVEAGVHNSQRFGPVVIAPPSGHSAFTVPLVDNGYLVSFPKNILYFTVANFRSRLTNWIAANTVEMSRIDDGATKFIKSMKKFFSKKDNLIHACTTTLNELECIQPSLLACLLGIPLLQEDLLNVVLPFVTEASMSSDKADVDFLYMVLQQMKWLPVIVNGKHLAEQVLQIFDVAVTSAQKNILRLLPEIFLPEQHPFLIPKLMEVFELGTQVNTAILDCFACLIVPNEDNLKIRRSAVSQMAKAPLEDLPSYFSFLFRADSPYSHLDEGIREMREKLEIKKALPRISDSPRTKDKKSNHDDAVMVEILERIRFCVSVKPLIAKIWLAHVKDDLTMEIELPAIDMIMLLIFVEASDSAAVNMLSNVFQVPGVANALFDKMLENNKPILHEIFPVIARFLDSCLRQKSSKCLESAAYVTKKLFVGLGPVLSQHLITNLIGILVNGESKCRDVVLKILSSIAETDSPKLLYFHSYLMGALVYAMDYPPRQMQSLINILASLAFMPENLQGEEDAFTKEFMNLLRKQVTNSHTHEKCVGVLGVIAAVKQLGGLKVDGFDFEGKIDTLLALAWNAIEKDDDASSIFFDELISCVKLLPRTVADTLRDLFVILIENQWTSVGEKEEDFESRSGKAGLELALAFDGNLELEEITRPVLKLESEALQMSALVLPSLFRVTAELEKDINENDIAGIDALLGCAVLFPKLSLYYERKDLSTLDANQRLYLGQYLIIALNFFRECVSAFVDSDNNELRVKVWMRLENIVTLQKYLVKHFLNFPSLPLAYGSEKSGVNSSTNSDGAGFSGALIPKPKVQKVKKPVGKKKTKAKSGKKKSKRANSDSEDEEVDDDEGEDLSPEETVTIATRSAADNVGIDIAEALQPKYIQPHIRKMDSKVFNSLLKKPLRTNGESVNYTDILLNLSTATQSYRTMKRIEQFTPETLVLVLSEMKSLASGSKTDFDITSVNDLLHNLCSHINTIAAHHKEDMNSSDSTSGPAPILQSCLKLVVHICDIYLCAIAKHSREAQEVEVCHIIQTLCNHQLKTGEDEDEASGLSQTDKLDKASEYLFKITKLIGPQDYPIAVDHVKLMKDFHDILPQKTEIKASIDKAIRFYLQQNWKFPASTVTSLLKTWFEVAPQPVQTLKSVAGSLFLDENDCIESSLPASTNGYLSCNKNNLSTWYAALITALAQHVYRNGRRKGDVTELMKLWEEGNRVMKILTEVAVLTQKLNMLVPLLRYGRIYCDAFISGGLPMLPALFKQDHKKGHEFLKPFQLVTRKLQHVCSHSKTKKDTLLLRYVPPMKKCLETLIFKVRETLGPDFIVWMGALKHRNLDGDVISSQAFLSQESDDEEMEQEENSGEREESDHEDVDARDEEDEDTDDDTTMDD